MIGWGLARRRRVVVNLTTGAALDGILWRVTRGLLVLRNATLHEPGAQPLPHDGEVLVELKRVAFTQVL